MLIKLSDIGNGFKRAYLVLGDSVLVLYKGSHTLDMLTTYKQTPSNARVNAKPVKVLSVIKDIKNDTVETTWFATDKRGVSKVMSVSDFDKLFGYLIKTTLFHVYIDVIKNEVEQILFVRDVG